VTIATAVSHYPRVGDAPGQQRLRQTIARADRGEATPDDVRAAADEMTRAALAEQEAAGLDLVTDGQVRWPDPITYVVGGLDGFEAGGLLRWFDSNTYYRQPRAAGEVRWSRPILVDDLAFATRHASRPVKAVVTGPYTLAALSDPADRDPAQLTVELAAALNQELRALAAAAPSWIQVDEPAIAYAPSVRYPRRFELFREAMERLVDGVPGRVSLAIYHGSAADVPGLFELPFSLLALDFVQGEANWELLDRWPAGLGLGLGVVDARNVRMETEEDVARAIVRAREAMGGQTGGAELHVSPSCGLEFLPRDAARRKLELLGRVVHGAGVGA
jgi:5-methyltetrahydropteroyltriglutamate--homocysteine methyltransferase